MEVLGEVDTPNGIEAADEWFACARVDSCDDGGDKVWAETAFVERGGDEVGHCFGFDFAFFTETVEVYFVAEEGVPVGCGWR